MLRGWREHKRMMDALNVNKLLLSESCDSMEQIKPDLDMYFKEDLIFGLCQFKFVSCCQVSKGYVTLNKGDPGDPSSHQTRLTISGHQTSE